MTQQKSKIPYFFFAFFAFILLVNLIYIYVATQTWRGVSVDKSYQRGVAYNQTIAIVKKQKEMGWKVKIKFDNLSKQRGILRVFAFDKKGNLMKDANVVALLKRPTQEGFDFEMPLIFQEKNHQAQIIFPLKGQWDFNLKIESEGEVFYQTKRFVVQ
jgi:nitrogen fixation protein FixH